MNTASGLHLVAEWQRYSWSLLSSDLEGKGHRLVWQHEGPVTPNTAAMLILTPPFLQRHYNNVYDDGTKYPILGPFLQNHSYMLKLKALTVFRSSRWIYRWDQHHLQPWQRHSHCISDLDFGSFSGLKKQENTWELKGGTLECNSCYSTNWVEHGSAIINFTWLNGKIQKTTFTFYIMSCE